MSNYKTKLITGAIVIFATISSTHAQFTTTGEVQFTGEIQSTCSLGNVSNGTLSPIATNSEFLTASPGSIDITTNGGAFISIGEPSLNTAPSDATLDIATSEARLQVGNIDISSGDAPEQIDTQGTSTASVSMSLSPEDSALGFPTGLYTAQVTVTCEFTSPSGILFGDS